MTELLLLLHAAATWGLVGLIWVVQLVQYPGFSRVGSPDFGPYHEHHCARITWVVAPLMAGELLTGLALLLERPPGLSLASLGLGLGLLALNWATTAFVFVPLHGRLRPLSAELGRLVTWNWVRTACWTARGAWILVVLLEQWPEAIPTT